MFLTSRIMRCVIKTIIDIAFFRITTTLNGTQTDKIQPLNKIILMEHKDYSYKVRTHNVGTDVTVTLTLISRIAE